MAQKKSQILLVEDEFFLAETIKARLEFNDYEVFLAENGQEAIDGLSQHQVDLILMDVIMPILDGLAATKKIRDSFSKETLPIIALTAKAREEDRNEALTAGCNDYLCKPFEMDDLLLLIRKYLKKDP